MSYNSSVYTDEQIKYILDLRAEGYTWDDIAEAYNEDFEDSKTPNAIRKTHNRFEDYDFTDEEMVTNIRKVHSASKSKSIVAKENKALLEYINNRDNLIDEIDALFKKVKFTKPKPQRVKKDRKKRNMTMEVMLSDLHYGKLTEKFDAETSREYARKMSSVVVQEVDRHRKNYNVERLVTLLIGDNIEGAAIHGVESRRASEFGDAEQTRLCILSLFEDYIVPIASLGIPLEFYCVTGNHSRLDMHKTYQNPGEEAFSWIIYHMLDLLCKKAGIKAKFIIPKGVYCIYEVYNNKVLVEHGDHIKGGMTRKACETHLAKRSTQIGELIDYMRIGHYHEITMYGRGKIIVNGSFPGQDSYSEINGYNSESSQVINYYVETDHRPTSYYTSFPVYLESNDE